MTSVPKTYEGTAYVSHTVTKIEMRRAPIKRWEVVVETSVPEGTKKLRFAGFFEIDTNLPPRAVAPAIDKFVAGMKTRWEKRTSESATWTKKLKVSLKEAVDEG